MGFYELFLSTADQALPSSHDVLLAKSGHNVDAVLAPPGWLAVPFVILLLMIATGPLLYERFWHRNYSKIASLLAASVVIYYLGILHDFASPLEALMEYVQFIALITALYVASGSILIKVNQQATPLSNLILLLIGAVAANLIGTTGASMLLIRPYIRMNQDRVKIYHIVFFIFMVSNIGGGLTPIGDPPLFLGFLSGVPFFWTLQHNFLSWLIAISLLSTIFYCVEVYQRRDKNYATTEVAKPAFCLVGKYNFIWLTIIIAAVFLDPNVFSWVPALRYNHHAFSFIRELILLSVAGLSYYYANKQALRENEFSWGPLKEVVLIFLGIFGTMIPALQLISAFAASEAGQAAITHNTLYWSTGVVSSVLDNAPTYLNFGAASMATHGLDITRVKDVQEFASGSIAAHSVWQLKAISVASVFFGAMTYIGNGPNFMVKAVAEQMGVRMPSFFSYVFRFSIPILLPILALVWVLFFAFL